MFEIFNNLINDNEVNSLFCILCALLLFAGSVAKSAQFPLHVWLPDAMEGSTPISALIPAATTGVFSKNGARIWRIDTSDKAHI